MGALIINNNSQALNTHRNLMRVDRQMKSSLEHLSSGMKINRAADGPAALMISEQMRSQIASIKQAIDNSETSVSMVQTTEAALDEVSRLLVSMRQLAVHAANEGANDQAMVEADQFEIANALEAIDQIAKFTQFGTRKILDGSSGVSGLTAGKGLTFLRATTETKQSPAEGYEVHVSQEATKATHTGTVALTPEVINQEVTLTVQENGRVANYVTTPGEDPTAVMRNLQNTIDSLGLELDVELAPVTQPAEEGEEPVVIGDTLRITHREYGAENDFTVVSDVAGVLSTQEGVPLNVANGQDIAGTINQQLTYGNGRVLTAAPGTAADGLQVLYNGPASADPEQPIGRVKVTQNSLTFQVGPQAGQKVKVALNGVSSKVMGQNVVNDSGFKNLSEIDVTSHDGATDTLHLIDKAIGDVTQVRGRLGAIQKNALESNIRSLQVAQEELTNSESTIRDADMAAEMSDLTRNQIILQAATSMLGQANQVPRNVLSLLQNG